MTRPRLFLARLFPAARLALLLMLPAATAVAAAPGTPVVVELFTSQGCNSCPPADAYLGELAKRQDILALAFHVDYWNYIGWTDPFALRASSERQRAYLRSLHQPYVYTPQIVVNGAAQGIGTERAAIEALLSVAPGKQPAHPDLALRWREDGALAVHVGDGASPEGEPATLWLVGFDRPHETKVLRGENDGRTLTDYRAVRSLRRLGAWPGWSLEMIVPRAEAVNLGSGGIAVLLQEKGTGPILTAAQIAQPAP